MLAIAVVAEKWNVRLAAEPGTGIGTSQEMCAVGRKWEGIQGCAAGHSGKCRCGAEWEEGSLEAEEFRQEAGG